MKYQLKLNLSKCIFGVKSRNLLGFVMSDGGIEVDLDNVKAIQTMPTYETKKNEKFFMQTS